MSKPKFLADENVAKLGKWLRIIGYDVAYQSPATDAELAQRASCEGRIILTRDRDFLKRHTRPKCLLLTSQDTVEQLRTVIEAFGLTLDREGIFYPVPQMQHPSGGDSEGGSQVACLCLRLSDLRPISPMSNLQKVFLARQSYSAFPQTTERNWCVSGHIGSETPSHSGNFSHGGNSLTVGMSISPTHIGSGTPSHSGTLSHSGNSLSQWECLSARRISGVKLPPTVELSPTAGIFSHSGNSLSQGEKLEF